MLILFTKNSVSSERTGRPGNETSVIQARSSEDSKDPNVVTAHERMGRPVITYDVITVHVLVMKAKDSTLKMKHFVKERGDPLLIMT